MSKLILVSSLCVIAIGCSKSNGSKNKGSAIQGEFVSSLEKQILDDKSLSEAQACSLFRTVDEDGVQTFTEPSVTQFKGNKVYDCSFAGGNWKSACEEIGTVSGTTVTLTYAEDDEDEDVSGLQLSFQKTDFGFKLSGASFQGKAIPLNQVVADDQDLNGYEVAKDDLDYLSEKLQGCR